MSIHNGWTKLYRVYKERAVFKDARMLQFFTWCLITAEYSPKEILVGYDAVVLQSGQLLLGKPGMRRAAEETGLSQQSMKTFVKKLSAGAKPLIRVETNPSFTIVTIVNPDTWESDQPAANPEVTRVQPAANPDPTREQPADARGEYPGTPRAPAPARVVEEETKENHTHTISAAGASTAQFRAAYRDALGAFREESGIDVCDPNTKAGARIIAQAIVAGELNKSALRAVIKNGLADAKLPNQSFRGIANNFAKYLPKETSVQNAVTRPILTFVCEDCGHVHRQYWTIPVEPNPIHCTADSGCKGRMLPHTAPIRASPSAGSVVVGA